MSCEEGSVKLYGTSALGAVLWEWRNHEIGMKQVPPFEQIV